MKRAVEKVVKRERKESSGSVDSKGQSPEPEGSGREELPDIRVAPKGNTAAGERPWWHWTNFFTSNILTMQTGQTT